MEEAPPTDPAALFRAWLGEWERVANQQSSELLGRPEVVGALQGMHAAKLRGAELSGEAAARFLTAVNFPSKSDIEALGMRLAAIEATLARIEAHQRSGGGTSRARAQPAPKRTRQPPV